MEHKVDVMESVSPLRHTVTHHGCTVYSLDILVHNDLMPVLRLEHDFKM